MRFVRPIISPTHAVRSQIADSLIKYLGETEANVTARIQHGVMARRLNNVPHRVGADVTAERYVCMFWYWLPKREAPVRQPCRVIWLSKPIRRASVRSR